MAINAAEYYFLLHFIETNWVWHTK